MVSKTCQGVTLRGTTSTLRPISRMAPELKHESLDDRCMSLCKSNLRLFFEFNNYVLEQNLRCACIYTLFKVSKERYQFAFAKIVKLTTHYRLVNKQF